MSNLPKSDVLGLDAVLGETLRFNAPISDDVGGIWFFGFPYVGTCIRIYILQYECVYIYTYVRDPVRLRFRHLYQVKFCSFIVRYPTAGGIHVLWTHF